MEKYHVYIFNPENYLIVDNNMAKLMVCRIFLKVEWSKTIFNKMCYIF